MGHIKDAKAIMRRGPAANTMPVGDQRRVPTPGTPYTVNSWTGPSENFDPSLVPAMPSHFRFDTTVIASIAPSLEPNAPASICTVLLLGPAGVGKTAMVKALANITGAPLLVYCGHTDTRSYDLVGKTALRDGATFFEEGVVVRAMRKGYWVLIDEISAIPPGALSAIHDVLAGGEAIHTEGGVVTRTPGFRVFATSNTMGSAAARKHRFGGANFAQSDALISRFAVKVSPPPMDATAVASLLRAHAPPRSERNLRALSEQVARFFIEARRAASDEVASLQYELTLREVLAAWTLWLRPLKRADGGEVFRSFEDVARTSFFHAYRPEEQAVVAELLRTHVEASPAEPTR